MIPLPLPPKVLEKDAKHGIFEIEALYPGYGATVGNSLRRVLLSSLEGAAITQMQIKGVSHEFSTIPGVQEDVIGIMLNLKQFRFRLHGEEPQRAVLKIKGEKEVKASDFELPSQVELISKDAPVATLTAKDAVMEMEIQIEKGVGYVPAELHKKGKQDIGTIFIDSIFTPIEKVVYHVENMRVGERTDFDRVRLEIFTDGSIGPEETLYQAADILTKQFEVVAAGLKHAQADSEKPKAAAKAVKEKASEKKETAAKKKAAESKKKTAKK